VYWIGLDYWIGKTKGKREEEEEEKDDPTEVSP